MKKILNFIENFDTFQFTKKDRNRKKYNYLVCPALRGIYADNRNV